MVFRPSTYLSLSSTSCMERGNITPDLFATIYSPRETRYRFRIINMACDPGYVFSIDKHSLTIIEADGENTKPLIVDALQIFAGQRYSVVVCDKITQSFTCAYESCSLTPINRSTTTVRSLPDSVSSWLNDHCRDPRGLQHQRTNLQQHHRPSGVREWYQLSHLTLLWREDRRPDNCARCSYQHAS